MTTTYDTDCQQAADTQGITAITTALAVRGIPVTIEQTGGMTMVATVHLPGDGVLALTQDGETTHVVEYSADQWAGSVDVEDSQVHPFVSLADAVNWTQARCAENVAAWWGSQIARNADTRGLTGGQVRATAEQQAEARWNWPSGRPRYTVAIDVPKRLSPSFRVRAYDDEDYIEPYTEHSVDGLGDAVAALMQAAREAGASPQRATPARRTPFGVASDTGTEQSVVVVFDLNGHDHADAAHRLADLLTGAGRTDNGVEAWWFPEPQDRHIDGNDRAPLILVPTQDDQECTCMPDGAGRHGRACEIYDGWNE